MRHCVLGDNLLTNTAITNAKPSEKPYKLSDEKGLYLLVQPKGGKLFRFDYRFDSKRKTLSIGAFPEVTLAQARERRDAARKLLANDPPIDPSEKKKSDKQEKKNAQRSTFEIVAREWAESYLKNKANSHKNKVIRRFELYIFPWIGEKPIGEITAPEFLKVIKQIQNLNKLETAHRALQTSGQVFRYGVQTGRAIRDVTADLRGALPSRQVKHMASITDPDKVGGLLNAIDAFNGSITVRCALRLLPLVFVRPGELRNMKWEQIDFENREWRYLVGKTNTEHIVPLSTQALEILDEIRPLSFNGEYVFQNGHSRTRPMSEAAINAALKRMGFDTQNEITGHGFRAMARTILHEQLEVDPHIIEHQLAHSVPDTLGKAYNRTRFIRQRKKMMQDWSDYLESLKTKYKG